MCKRLRRENGGVEPCWPDVLFAHFESHQGLHLSRDALTLCAAGENVCEILQLMG